MMLYQIDSNRISENFLKLYVPKIICLISCCPVLEFQKQFLAFIYKFTITSKLTKQPPKLQIYQHLYERFTQLLVEEQGQFQKAEKKWDEQIYQSTLNQIQTANEDDEIAKQFKLKEEFLVNFSISMLFRVHTLQNLGHKNAEIIFNLSNEEICRLRPISQQSNNFFTLSNFSFRPLFEKISVKTTQILVQSILLEKQILIVSSNPNEIISICESLFTLIYPLKWACIYIPLLPLQLSEMIHAMMPYIIGISKKNYLEIKQKIDHKDKVVIDLDNDTVQQTEIHKIPEYLSIYLQNNIKELFKKFFTAKNEEQKKKNAWIEVIFQLKRIFLNFMTCLINNLTPFFLYSNKFDKDNVASRDIFAKSEYVQIFDQNEKSFMTELCQNTMMFSKFLEDSYRILYITEFKKEEIDPVTDDKEGLFFFLKNIKKINKCLPKGNIEKKFDIISNPLIFSALDYELASAIEESVQEYKNPQTIDLTPHLIKYLKFIENKNPEQNPNYPSGSAKQLTISKTVFKKLEKEWLMPIPKPIINQPVVKVNENIDQKSQIQQNNNQARNKSLENSLQRQNQSYDNINQSLNQSQSIRSSQQLGQTLNNTFIAPKENYKDPYFVNEHYSEPSITQNPIMFYRNVYLEYDAWHNRVFQQEFDKINLEFPLKRQLDINKKYNIFSTPETRPIVKNIEDMIYMQDILARMIQDSLISKQQPRQNYPQTQYQNNFSENPRANNHNQPHSYQENFYSQKYNQTNHNQLNFYKPFNQEQKTQSNLQNPNKQSNSHNQSNLSALQNISNQNTQLPPHPRTQSEYISSHEELNSQRQHLGQLNMKNLLNVPPLSQYQTNNTNKNNTHQNQISWNNGTTEDNQKQHSAQQSQRTRITSVDLSHPSQQVDYNKLLRQPLQQNPQKYNNKLLPPSLDQKIHKNLVSVDQINTTKAQTTTNINNKRLSIFQNNQMNTKQQLPSQKENIPRSMSQNNENLNLNNTPFSNNKSGNAFFNHQKNPSLNTRVSETADQYQQKDNAFPRNNINQRQNSTKQRQIFH